MFELNTRTTKERANTYTKPSSIVKALRPGIIGTRYGVTKYTGMKRYMSARYDAQATVDGVHLHVHGRDSKTVRRVMVALKRIVRDNPPIWRDLAVNHDFPAFSFFTDDDGYADMFVINADDYTDDLNEIPF